MRARSADGEGFVERDGVRIHYEVYGDGEPAVLLMPTWTVVHKRFWKAQIPYLARHHRVIVYDGPGNGESGRPLDPAAYTPEAQVGYATAVLDAAGAGRAVLVALSKAANWALCLAADHPERVLGTVLIGPTVSLSGPSTARGTRLSLDGPAPVLEPSRVPDLAADPPGHWAKYNRAYWREGYEDFLWFFFGQCFPEPHSTKQIEDAVAWGLETTGEVLVADSHGGMPPQADVLAWCGRIASPLLLLHGDDDRISSHHRSERLREETGAELVTLAGAGHIPLARDPVKVNLLLHDFITRLSPPREHRTLRRWDHRPRRVLYLCSPIGLGHARRDIAIAGELRKQRPGVEIDWLTQHPVTRLLERAGERIHPACSWLVAESAHIEAEAGEHDLHCFEALRRMDEILVANFMVFHDVVRDGDYDLVVADEAWDVDHFLHENPRLKTFAYAWLTDFVGLLPMPGDGPRRRLVTADYNEEMIRHVARHPRVRDRALFVGDPEDVVTDRFGPELPFIREWTRANYDFTGYVTGFDQASLPSRAALREELGYGPGERVCVVTAGGSGVGRHLLQTVVDAYPEAARRVPGLRMIVVTGPRVDPGDLHRTEGVELRSFVPDLPRHLAAADLAVVQGGLTTCMELTAAGRPFLYVPLRNHFEQQFHVAHRLHRHGAGRRLDYAGLTAPALAEAISTEIGRDVTYLPVPADGATRAAALLAELL
ncbi:alpha/beta hydrolase [Actinocorallia longicatena]|uniref:Pimeloyl-ACP methyl ester carboxylesterase n=1 Tax=Actinocorallia longicatena TaxID=111803 RepID=A0ABP6QJE3_9ACTN